MAHIKFFFWYFGLLFLSLLANMSIKVIPFKTLIQKITNSEMISDEHLIISSRQRERLIRATELLERIRESVPWRVYCFEQALVLLIIAKVLGVNMNIYFGLQKSNENVRAHAWTKAGNEVFTGKEECKNFVSVFSRGYYSRNYNVKEHV